MKDKIVVLEYALNVVAPGQPGHDEGRIRFARSDGFATIEYEALFFPTKMTYYRNRNGWCGKFGK